MRIFVILAVRKTSFDDHAVKDVLAAGYFDEVSRSLRVQDEISVIAFSETPAKHLVLMGWMPIGAVASQIYHFYPLKKTRTGGYGLRDYPARDTM